MILFKYPEKQRELACVDQRLRKIIEYMAHYAFTHWRDDLVITEIYRDREGSVHKYFRGVDLALLYRGDSEQLRRTINQRFPYDLLRPNFETIPELRHGTAPHFHVQVRPE